MSYEEVIFYFVAAVTVLGALGVVLARNVVHCALFLILALLAVAGVFILLSAEFLAIVQVLIYGGAVTILILFAIKLTRVRDRPQALDGPHPPLAPRRRLHGRAGRDGGDHAGAVPRPGRIPLPQLGGAVRDRLVGAAGGAHRRDHPGPRRGGRMMFGGKKEEGRRKDALLLLSSSPFLLPGGGEGGA